MNGATEFVLALTALATAIGGLVITGIKVYKGAKKELNELPKKIKRQSNIDIDITQMLEDLKELLNADRVQIYDFHNGGHYANGRSALKTSCTYEVVRTGIHSKQAQLQNIPISCIPKFVCNLLDKGVLAIDNVEELKDSMPSTYELKKDQGVMGFYDIVLNNKYGEPIGFLAVQYVKNKYQIHREFDRQEILKVKFFVEKNLENLL